jgi:hypothetical protein
MIFDQASSAHTLEKDFFGKCFCIAVYSTLYISRDSEAVETLTGEKIFPVVFFRLDECRSFCG